jgi:hypothetical protein
VQRTPSSVSKQPGDSAFVTPSQPRSSGRRRRSGGSTDPLRAQASRVSADFQQQQQQQQQQGVPVPLAVIASEQAGDTQCAPTQEVVLPTAAVAASLQATAAAQLTLPATAAVAQLTLAPTQAVGSEAVVELLECAEGEEHSRLVDEVVDGECEEGADKENQQQQKEQEEEPSGNGKSVGTNSGAGTPSQERQQLAAATAAAAVAGALAVSQAPAAAATAAAAGEAATTGAAVPAAGEQVVVAGAGPHAGAAVAPCKDAALALGTDPALSQPLTDQRSSGDALQGAPNGEQDPAAAHGAPGMAGSGASGASGASGSGIEGTGGSSSFLSTDYSSGSEGCEAGEEAGVPASPLCTAEELAAAREEEVAALLREPSAGKRCSSYQRSHSSTFCFRCALVSVLGVGCLPRTDLSCPPACLPACLPPFLSRPQRRGQPWRRVRVSASF